MKTEALRTLLDLSFQDQMALEFNRLMIRKKENKLFHINHNLTI